MKYDEKIYKEQLIYEFIPRIKQMCQDEKDHLKFLINSKENLIKKSKKLFSIVFKVDLIEIDFMIERSKKAILHFEKRLEEYTRYELCYIKKEQLN